MVDEAYNREISIHIQWNPRCAVADSVPVFTYASLTPVTRRHAGVLVEVGYMRYLALMPPPVVSTPTGIYLFHLHGISNQVYGGVHATTQVLHRNSGRSDVSELV